MLDGKRHDLCVLCLDVAYGKPAARFAVAGLKNGGLVSCLLVRCVSILHVARCGVQTRNKGHSLQDEGIGPFEPTSQTSSS